MKLGTAFTLPRDIDADLDHWLEPFLAVTGRNTRRTMAPLDVRELLGSGGRKSIQPMAERLGLSGTVVLSVVDQPVALAREITIQRLQGGPQFS